MIFLYRTHVNPRLSVTVIPRSDAESKEHPVHQTVYAVFTGFRVGARNDSYRQPGLQQDVFVNEIMCHI